MNATEYYNQTPRPGQEFGAQRDGGKRHHEGTDFSHSSTPGTVTVPIVEAGVCTGNYWTAGYGWRVDVGPWSYSHLNERSPLQVGRRYDAGTIAGHEGETGWSDGPCCHVEYVMNGRKVDPEPIIRARLFGTSTSGGPSAPITQTTTPEGNEDEMKIYSHGGNYLIIGPSTFLELGASLTKQTGVDGAETLALYRKLGAPEIKLTKREWDVLRINTRASQ